MAACTFGGTSFDLLTADGMIPYPTRDSFISERHIPGSDITYVDLGGLGPRHLNKLPCKVESDVTMSALAAKLNTQATLVYDGITYTGAVMKALDIKGRVAGGGTTVFFTVDFVF